MIRIMKVMCSGLKSIKLLPTLNIHLNKNKMKLYNKAIIAISILLIGCYYHLEEPEKVIELESSNEPLIELKCGNYDTLARKEFDIARAGKSTCQAIITCDGFDFELLQDYYEDEADLLEFESPAYSMVFCYFYAVDEVFELAGVDYVSPSKKFFKIPHLKDTDTYQVKVYCNLGEFIYTHSLY